MELGVLPTGSRGFDCNTKLSLKLAKNFRAHGYRFAVRYVRRSELHNFDLTRSELRDILTAGLGLMVVQHVAVPGWRPNGVLGKKYGMIAAQEAGLTGYPMSAHLWCDLEEVADDTPAQDVIDYCNAWYDAVLSMGFRPGLYVGYKCGLNPDQLYRKLKFRAYWAAYNLDQDKYPAGRGVMMKQYPYPPAHNRVPDTPFEYDENVIMRDKLGASPILLLP